MLREAGWVMGMRDFLWVYNYFKPKRKKPKHKTQRKPAPGPTHPESAPHLTFLPSPRALSFGKTGRGLGGWGAAAHAQSWNPAASPGSHACAVSALGRRASPSLRRGTGQPWPLRVSVFSGSWGASCCLQPQLPLVPYLRGPHRFPPFLWPAGCCHWGFACPHFETAGPAGVCGCSPPPVLSPSGPWWVSCCRCLQSIPGFYLHLLFPLAPSFQPCPLGPSLSLLTVLLPVSRGSLSVLSTVSQTQAPHLILFLSSYAAGAGSQALFFPCCQLCLLAATSQSPPGSCSLPIFISFSFLFFFFSPGV